MKKKRGRKYKSSISSNWSGIVIFITLIIAVIASEIASAITGNYISDIVAIALIETSLVYLFVKYCLKLNKKKMIVGISIYSVLLILLIIYSAYASPETQTKICAILGFGYIIFLFIFVLWDLKNKY